MRTRVVGFPGTRVNLTISAEATAQIVRERPRSPGDIPVRASAGLASVAAVPRLEYPTYLDHIRTESARFREVLTDCDPSARVPTCPDWDAADLLWHLAGVQLFWAKVIRHRPASPDDPEIGQEDAAQRPETLRRAARRLRRLLPRAGHRARAGRPGGRGLALVGRPPGRHVLPPPGPRGRDPPDRRRADRRRTGHAARRRAGRRRRGRGARGDVRRRAAVGHVHPVRRDDRRRA